jgi:predicted Zn-dependent protease
MNPDDILNLARSTFRDAEIEVRVDHLNSALTRFANSFIHQNVAEDVTTASLRVHSGGRTVAVSSTLSDIKALVERASAAITVAPLDPGWPGLTGPAPLAGLSAVDEATAAATPDERAQVVEEFVRAAGGLETAGYCRTAYWAGSYRNTNGQALDAAATDAALDGIARLNGADAVSRRSSDRLSDLDGAEHGARVATSVRSQADPVELPPGRYEVVLMPEATADILGGLSLYGFNGRFANDGRSFAELGTRQFDSSITIVDEPFPAAYPFDFEGTPRTQLKLVDQGVTSAIAHDRRTAAKAGVVSTGHHIGSEGPFGPFPVNPGFVPGTSTLDEMIASVERGLLITDFWYTRVLDPRTLVITGLTRNGAWLIEGGKVVHPVKNLRFTQAYPQALAPGKVLGVGAEVVPQPDRKDLVNSAAVALRLAEWNFTGGASG